MPLPAEAKATPGFCAAAAAKVLQRADRRIGLDHQDGRRLAHEGDGREVGLRVVAGVAVELLVDGVRAHRAHHDGVAVGGRTRHQPGADGAAPARAVLDHHGLAQRLLHRAGHDAGHRIRAGARPEGHDHLERPVGEVAGPRSGRRGQAQGRAGREGPGTGARRAKNGGVGLCRFHVCLFLFVVVV